jgi:hypothetical protein
MIHVRSQRSPTVRSSGLPPPRHLRRSTPPPPDLRAQLPQFQLPAGASAKAGQQLAHSFADTKLPTIPFSVASALFAARAKTNPCVSISFRTLLALFCTRAKTNSPVFKRPRTLWKNHRGGGGGHFLQLWALLGAHAETSLGSPWSPRKNGCGLYLQPAQSRNQSGLYLEPAQKRVWAVLAAHAIK